MADSKVKNKIKLSILVPIYNHCVESLVVDLKHQCQKLNLDWEIILLEDGSQSVCLPKNSALAEDPCIIWKYRAENKGRAFSRNELAQIASGNYLLFLDADSEIIAPFFIHKYLSQLPTKKIICGGRTYSRTPPKDQDNSLHWSYGNIRESKSKAFMSNNFLVPRDLMIALPFDSNIDQYGHEDTLFGQQLSVKGKRIIKIKNPILHAQLHSAADFLKNSKQAVENLFKIKKYYPEFKHPILSIAKALSFLKVSSFFISTLGLFEKKIQRNLTQSSAPCLLLLDLQKLLWALRVQVASTN